MLEDSPSFGRPLIILTLMGICLCMAALLIIPPLPAPTNELRGLLVDLELAAPDPRRYETLREVFTRRLPLEFPALENVRVSLEYTHFSQIGSSEEMFRNADFVLLSPQGAPWHRYAGEAETQLEHLKRLTRERILRERKPVLGICGGHQFLALTFGGTIDFIDPALRGTSPERYPKGALAERGSVLLETLRADPILEGIVVHPGRFTVLQSHYEEIRTVPAPFVNVARSSLSEAQLITIPGLPVYGMAFHPERGWDLTDGSASDLRGARTLLANYMQMALSHKRNR